MAKPNLAKFEDRMLKLKGIRLPAKGVIEPTYSSNGKRPQIITNSLCHKLNTLPENHLGDEYERDEVLDDIISGVIASFGTATSHKGFKLNKAVVRSMLDKLPSISQLSIMENYGYGRQQASRYLQACKLVAMFYKRHSIKQSLAMLAKFSEVYNDSV